MEFVAAGASWAKGLLGDMIRNRAKLTLLKKVREIGEVFDMAFESLFKY